MQFFRNLAIKPSQHGKETWHWVRIFFFCAHFPFSFHFSLAFSLLLLFAGDTAWCAHDLMLTIALRQTGCTPSIGSLGVRRPGHHGISSPGLSTCRVVASYASAASCRAYTYIRIQNAFEDEHTD